METINQLKTIHYQVQNNMFRILTDYDILSEVATTCFTRSPLYYVSEQFKFFIFEVESEVKPHLNSISRLLETGFIKIVADSSGSFIFFIKSENFENCSVEEKEYLIEIPEQNFIELFKSKKRFSFLDEIL